MRKWKNTAGGEYGSCDFAEDSLSQLSSIPKDCVRALNERFSAKLPPIKIKRKIKGL